MMSTRMHICALVGHFFVLDGEKSFIIIAKLCLLVYINDRGGR